MKVRLRIVLCLLLAAAAAWLFWFRPGRPMAGQGPGAAAPAVAAHSPAAPAAGVTNAAIAKASSTLSAACTNRLAFRLTNTTKSINEMTGDPHVILLENAIIDTTAKMDLKIPSNLKAAGEPGAYIVQSRGVVNGAFRAAIGAAGGEITPSYIPNNAFIVLVSSAGAAVLAENPLVQAVLPYEPYYKVSSTLLGLAVDQKPLPAGTYLTLGLFSAGAQATEEQIEALGAPIMSKDRSPFGPIVRVRPPTDWVALANLPGVQIVEPVYLRKAANDLSRVALGVSTNTTDGSTNDWLGLTGKKVLVEVNDTGIDPTHPDFSATGTAGSGPSGPTRVTGDDTNSLDDTDGHGTHVAGIIAGNGSMSITPFNVGAHARGSVTNADFRGKAPNALLYSVGFLGANDGGADDSYLQEAPALTNALISNNSWVNAGDNEYDLSAASYDAATRDAVPEETGPQPVLFVFAAGNGGGGDDGGSGGSSDSINSPGTAKDVITVGALEQLRDITNIVTELGGASNAIWTAETSSKFLVPGYSARGNVGVETEGAFGRFKPDVIAPGTFVVSTRSQEWDEYAYYNPTNYHDNVVNDFVVSNSLAYGFITVPQNAVGLTIQVFPDIPLSPANFPTNFPIYVSSTGVPDPNDPTTYDIFSDNGIVSIPPDTGGAITGISSLLNGGVIYAIGDPTNTPIYFDVLEQVITTNDLGNELIILSNLNNSISGDPDSNKKPHYYRYETGTSMAAASVSGVLALMQDFFTNTLQTTPSPALLKAMLINGAQLTGNYQFGVTNTINYEGWGQVNLPNSIPAALTNTAAGTTNAPLFFIDQNPTNVLATGDSRTYLVSVPTPAARAQPLRVTLAWTDPPGNPAAAVKLVNSLQLIVTNLANGSVYYANNFSAFGTPPYSAPANTNLPPGYDLINNVQNVFLPPTLGTNYSVTVFGQAVNVNAVTENQTNIVQDFALVIADGGGSNTNGISVTAAAPALASDIAPDVGFLVATNGIYFDQFAGANAPWLSTNDLGFGTNLPYGSGIYSTPYGTNAEFAIGQTNQWHFYVITNTMAATNSAFTNAAFIVFLPNTAALPREGVFADTDANSTRPEAELSLLVASPQNFPLPGDANAGALTNLDVNVISNCLFGLNGDASETGPGGSKFIAYSNSQPNQVYYIGVQCQDQTAGQFAFIPVFSAQPFSSLDNNGNEYVNAFNVPMNIPDGNNRHPGVSYVMGLALQPMEIRRVIATNTITHQNFGDLIGTLSHSGTGVVLNNHDGLGPVVNDAFIYDDSGQGDILRSTHTDGPGSLNNFRTQEAAGLWVLNEIDDSPGNTGTVENLQMRIEPHRTQNGLLLTVTVPPGGWYYDYINVPVGYTNLLVVATNLAPTVMPPVQLYVQDGSEPTLANTNGVSLTNCVLGNYPTGVNPGNSISTGPPLAPGTYYIGLYNPSTTAATVEYGAFLSFNSAAVSTVDYASGGQVPLLDDAVTYDSINVTNTDIIQDFNVGLRIDHPRISDLVLTLISPDGSRYLLMENRGGQSTNGCGVTVVTTNLFNASADGTAQPNTNYLNLDSVSGSLPITYNFYTAPDEMTIYYGTNVSPAYLIYDTGVTNNPSLGAGSQNTQPATFILNYGPTNGITSTYITIVMDQFPTNFVGGTNRSDFWTYTAGGVETNYEYLTFTDDTNLTMTPIKYAPPPFVPYYATGDIWTDSFEAYAPGTYMQGATGLGGWNVLTNQIEIVTNPAAFQGTNLLQLDNGAMATNLPTLAGHKYFLTYEQGSKAPQEDSSAATNANWLQGNVTFIAPQAGSPLVLDASGDGFNTNSVLADSYDTNTLFDDFALTELPLDLYYQPEQSLTPLNDTSAFGTWTLEILDNRAGATNFTPTLVSWQLGFTFANTNYTIPLGNLNSGVIETNYAPPGSLTWLAIPVPPNAIAQTNALIFASLPLNIYFSITNAPTTNSPFGIQEQTNSVGGIVVVYPTSVPPMVPGTTNYIGIQNLNQFGATYAIGVTFELTNLPDTNVATPFASTLPATLVTGTNAQLNGFATPNGTNSVAWFQWGTTTNYGNVTPAVNVGGGYGVVYVTNAITNLIFAQVYHVRLVVTNALGVTYGADQQFAPGFPVVWGDDILGQTNVPAGFSNVVQLAGGLNHSLALQYNGTVTGWGDDSLGQTNVPAGLTNVAAIAAGGNDSLALLANGTVVEWGDFGSDQTIVPAYVTNIVMIAAGWSNSVALMNNGNVVAWGDNTYGQTNVPAILVSNVVAVAAGGNDVMALLNNGMVVSWGRNTGQTNVPVEVTNAVAIAEGEGFHSLALSNNAVAAWGTPVSNSIPVPPGLTNVVAIAAGLDDSLVLQNNGSVVAWGNNTSNQTNVPVGLPTVFAVACGADHDLVLTPEPPVLPPYANTMPATSVTGTNAQINGFATANNNVSSAWFQWGPSTNYGFQTAPVVVNGGYNVVYVTNAISGLVYGKAYHFQLVVSNALGIAYGFDQLLVAGSTVAWGDNTFGQSTPPPGISNVVVTIAAGGYHGLEALIDGSAQAWGDNANGQTIIPAGLSNVVAVAGGLYHSLALQSNGIVTAWGYNNDGQATVPVISNNVVVVAGGGYASVALQNNGLLAAWGDNTYGQTNIPAGLSNVVEVAEGAEHALALLNNGTVVAWGTNNYGQASVPAGLDNVVAVSAGAYHSLALLNNGTVVAWGDDSLGQTNVPPGQTNVIAIAAGSYHNLALLSDGSVLTWGDDNLGQTNVPSAASNVVAVAAGAYHSEVLTSPFDINLNLFSNPGGPLTNIVAPGGINWIQVNVPTNAVASTNALLFATLPLNFWWSTNVPPSITTTNDRELLTNLETGSVVLYSNTPAPTIVPGGTYYLGVQNPNSVAVTNAVQVTFEYALVPPVLPFFFQLEFIPAGSTLTVTNTATDIYTNDYLSYALTTNIFFAEPANPTNYPVIDTNGIITWVTSTNDPFSFSLLTTTATDTNTALSAMDYILAIVFPQFNIFVPNTNTVSSNSLTWYLVQVPTNAIAATNTLLSSTAPVSLWYSTNLPPTITNSDDVELLTNSVNGTNVISLTNTIPVLLPGGYYFLGVQNTNNFSVTNVLEVSFAYRLVPPVLPVIPNQVIPGGATLTVTNTATDTNAGAMLLYTLVNPPMGASIDTNGIIIWATTTNIAPTNVVITTIVTDTGAGLSATNSFEVFVLPSLLNGQPGTNVVGTNSINWYLVQVPKNAIAATNTLLFATAPVNLWYSTNLPPTITNAPGGDFELLTNSVNGTNVINVMNTVPVLVPGGYYFLGVQNLNAVPVTNAIEVTFDLVNPVFSIFSIVQTNNAAGTNGFLLTWYAPTNTQFHLLWTPELAPASWTNFKGVISFTSYISATNSQFQYFDDGSQAPFGPTRFYRLLLLNSPTNDAPEFLSTPTNRYVNPQTTMTVPNPAHDWNVPAQTLVYQVHNTLPGVNVATITPGSGLITWTPDDSQAGMTNFITTIATDSGVPAMSATNLFIVIVNPIPPVPSIVMATNGISLSWSGPTNEQFEIRWTTNLTPPANWMLFPPPPITSTNGMFNFTDTNAPFLMKFYQLILLP